MFLYIFEHKKGTPKSPFLLYPIYKRLDDLIVVKSYSHCEVVKEWEETSVNKSES
jgi:hypothetical protein